MAPLGSQGHLGDDGKPTMFKKQTDPCPCCNYRYVIVEGEVSQNITRMICPQCSTSWEKIRAKKQKPPAPPKPPRPTGPSYGSPADRAAVAEEPDEPHLVKGSE